ncbi:MAG: hypothetical protein KF729_13065 [Sandaracinaceae bacterium]|nr:hypothetical protein [Sandaracinaceae bacterium]
MDAKQFDILLHDAEVKLKRLKALYEQWFQGIERLEPTVPRKELDRVFEVLNKEKPRNTASRFKLNTIQARYGTYATHWQRIARQIEEGTYERDLRRVQRRKAAPKRERAEEVRAYEIDIETDDFDPDSLFANDEISSILTALDDKAPRPSAAPARRGLSAFSGLSGAKSAPPRVDDSVPPLAGEDTAPNAVNPFAPVAATFGKPKSHRPPAGTGPRPAHPDSGTRPLPPAPPVPGARPGAAARRVSGARPAPPPPPVCLVALLCRPATPAALAVRSDAAALRGLRRRAPSHRRGRRAQLRQARREGRGDAQPAARQARRQAHRLRGRRQGRQGRPQAEDRLSVPRGASSASAIG